MAKKKTATPTGDEFDTQPAAAYDAAAFAAADDQHKAAVEAEVREKLDELHRLRQARAQIDLDFQAAVDKAVGPRLAATLERMRTVYKEKCQGLEAQASSAEAVVKAIVLELGRTVHGEELTGQWGKGKLSVDTKQIETLALVYEPLKAVMKYGQPNVSIVKTSDKAKKELAEKLGR